MVEQNTDWTTVIGSDVVIKGEISVEKGLRVDGRIEGSVSTKGRMFIGKTGNLNADLEVGSLTLEGFLDGTVIAAQKVEIEGNGQLIGEVTAAQLNVKEGAVLNGKVSIGKPGVKHERHEKETAKPEPAAAVARLNNATSKVA